MKSGYKEIGFGKQTIAKVFEESGKVTMLMICWKIFLRTI